MVKEDYNQQVFLATQHISKLLRDMATKAILTENEPIFIAALNHYLMVTAVVCIKGSQASKEEVKSFLQKMEDMAINAFMENWEEVQQQMAAEIGNND